MADLKVEYYDLADSGATFYAILFAPNGQALKDTAGEWALDAFVAANQDDYAILLTEHTERSQYFSATIDEADLTLADNAFGESYTVEIWQEATPATQDRTADTLVEVISLKRETQIFHWDIFCTASYDHETQRLSFLIYMLKDGMIHPATDVEVVVHDSSDTAVVTLISSTLGSLGQFNLESTPVALSPDENYFAQITVTDEDSEGHVGAVGINTWD